MNKFGMVACGAVLSVLLAGPAAAAGYGAVYAFGDSLSDAGNDWTATGHVLPSAPYNAGRFSNGNVWVQDVSISLGLGAVAPSLLRGGTDFAYGGAQTGATAVHGASPIDLAGQLVVFAAAVHGHAPSGALYTLSIGGNDLMAAVGASAGVRAQVVAQAAANSANFLTGLALLGARRFVVLNVPDLGHVPAVNGTAGQAATGRALAASFNAALAARLAALRLSFGARVAVVDAFGLLDQAVAAPAAAGFSDVTHPCWTGGYTNPASGTLCAALAAAQDTHLFWDTVHPTEAGHRLIAAQAWRQLP